MYMYIKAHKIFINTHQFSDDSAMYVVVGTAIALPHESEPSEGRILVFEVVDRKLRLVAEKDIKGAAYTLKVCVCVCVCVLRLVAEKDIKGAAYTLKVCVCVFWFIYV